MRSPPAPSDVFNAKMYLKCYSLFYSSNIQFVVSVLEVCIPANKCPHWCIRKISHRLYISTNIESQNSKQQWHVKWQVLDNSAGSAKKLGSIRKTMCIDESIPIVIVESNLFGLHILIALIFKSPLSIGLCCSWMPAPREWYGFSFTYNFTDYFSILWIFRCSIPQYRHHFRSKALNSLRMKSICVLIHWMMSSIAMSANSTLCQEIGNIIGFAGNWESLAS